MSHALKNVDLSAVVANDRAHVWHHLTQHIKYETVDPMVIVAGKGIRLWDADGKEYVDATSGGVWTANLGYGNTFVADALYTAIVKMNFYSGSAGTVPAAQFSQALINKMPGMNRVYYSNSGSEANEKGFKIVRQISAQQYGGKKNKILYRDRDYHGTTITALSASGHEQRRDKYGPFTPDFVEVPKCYEYRSQFGDVTDYGVRAARAIEAVILREDPDTIGGLCLEPITAGGGVLLPAAGYWEIVQEICKKYNILLHIDEVVCGIGRTGKWFGYQHYGVKPDIVTMAKGVAAGYAAISCTVTTERVFDLFKQNPDDTTSYFRDISTFGGCTGGPAAALATMEYIVQNNLLENCQQMGDYLLAGLQKLQAQHPIVGDVRGKGLFCGAELVADRNSKQPVADSVTQGIVAACQAQGVLIGAANRSFSHGNNVLLFSPAFICTKEDIDIVLAAVDSALAAA